MTTNSRAETIEGLRKLLRQELTLPEAERAVRDAIALLQPVDAGAVMEEFSKLTTAYYAAVVEDTESDSAISNEALPRAYYAMESFVQQLAERASPLPDPTTDDHNNCMTWFNSAIEDEDLYGKRDIAYMAYLAGKAVERERVQ